MVSTTGTTYSIQTKQADGCLESVAWTTGLEYGASYDRAVGSSPGVGRLIDQSGDTAEGIEIEARSAEKIIRLHFQLSGWALVALSYFED